MKEKKMMSDEIEDCIKNAFCEMIQDYVNEIMRLKSVSYAEALQIALSFYSQGIAPKSDEFYNNIGCIKTLWEY